MNMKDNPKLPNYYTILPACIRLNHKIIPGAKLLWSDITVLSLKEGYCYSTNDFFARIYGVKIRTINTWVRNLKQLELVTITHIKMNDGKKIIRHIKPNTSHPELAIFFDKEGKKMLSAYEKNKQLSHEKKCSENITSNNNTRLIKGIPLTELTSVDCLSESELDNCLFYEAGIMNHDIKTSDFFNILERLTLEYSQDKEVMLRKLEEEEKLEVIRKRLSYYRSKESGVPRFLWNDSLRTYHPRTEEEKTNYEKILAFVTNNENHITLILTGRCGTGKSHLGAGIINSLGGKMIDADTLLLQVDSGDNFKSSENKLEILSRFSTYKLLVIDEIGRSMDIIKEKGYLSYIIRNRYNNRLPTVLISNLTKTELLKFFGEAIFDRFQETCIYLEFTGESYRPSIRDVNL